MKVIYRNVFGRRRVRSCANWNEALTIAWRYYRFEHAVERLEELVDSIFP